MNSGHIPSMLLVGCLGLGVFATLPVATRAQTPPAGASLTVTVKDLSNEATLRAVSVKVIQPGAPALSNITGANGSVTFSAVRLGQASVECLKEGYEHAPEVATTVVAAPGTKLEMKLLARVGAAEYYQAAGRNIEATAQKLPSKDRATYYKLELDRAKQLDFGSQLPLLMALPGGRTYMALDPTFKSILDRINGVAN